MHAELRAIYEGIKLVTRWSYQYVIIEVNNLKAIQILNEVTSPSEMIGLAQVIPYNFFLNTIGTLTKLPHQNLGLICLGEVR